MIIMIATIIMFMITMCVTHHTPNLPTKIIPAKMCWLKISGIFPMDSYGPGNSTP